MTKLTMTFLPCVVALSLVAQAGQAQSLADFDAEGRSDLRALASVTIPIGGTRSSDDARPRLDFAFQNQEFGGAQSVTPLRFDPDFQRRSIRAATVSFTLEQNSRMLMNGRRIATFGPALTADEDEENGGGGNTALYVIGGVLALGVIGTVALATDVRDAASDVIGPAD